MKIQKTISLSTTKHLTDTHTNACCAGLCSGTSVNERGWLEAFLNEQQAVRGKKTLLRWL